MLTIQTPSRASRKWMESLMEFALAALALGVLLGVLRILGGILQ